MKGTAVRRGAGLGDRLRLLEKEIAGLGDELASRCLRLTADAEGHQAEIAAPRRFFALALPDFRRRYLTLRDWALQETKRGLEPEEPPTGC